MRASTIACDELVQLSQYTGELERLRHCGDDDRIDRAFNAVCRQIWGYTLDDFDDESLCAKDHAWLDRLTWKRACALAAENGYDLVDHGTGAPLRRQAHGGRESRRRDPRARVTQTSRGILYNCANCARILVRRREDGMELIIALCFFVTIWILVLWGSRYFGPKDS